MIKTPPPAPQPLAAHELHEALAELPGWALVRAKSQSALARRVLCAGFPEAMALVNAVADIAERLDHHPDLRIEFNRITFTLSSHDAGGVTRRDLKLAREIDAAAQAAGARALEAE